MKNIFIIISFFLAISLQGQTIFQSDFEDWTGGVPDDWNGSQTNIGTGNYVEYTTSAQSGTSACQLINTTSSHKRFSTQGVPIVTGQAYDVIFWVRGQGEVRSGLYNGVDAGQNAYQSYITVNSSTWTMQTQTITSGYTNSAGQFIISLRNTNATQDHLQIDNVTIQYSSAIIDTVSIYDIQYSTASPEDSPYMDQTVYTTGVVTAFKPGGFFIQDGVGPWSGLYIYNNTFTVAPGDSILIQGKIVEYFNMTEMTQVAVLTVLGQTTVPAPTGISTAQVNMEEYESVLVRVFNAECTNPNPGFSMWAINDGSGVAKVDTFFYDYPNPTLGVFYNVTGPVMYSFSEFRIEPRNAGDVEINTSVEESEIAEFKIYPNPASDIVKIFVSENCELNITNILGQNVYSSELFAGESKINIASWQAGIYLVNVSTDDAKKSVYKLVKN